MWVLEFGKYDPRKYVNEGPTSMAIVERYLFQAAFRLLKRYSGHFSSIYTGASIVLTAVHVIILLFYNI